MKFQTKMFNEAKKSVYTPGLYNLLKRVGYDIKDFENPIPLEMVVDSNRYSDEYGVKGYAYVIRSKEYVDTTLKLVFIITDDSVAEFEIDRMLCSAFNTTCNHIDDNCGCRQDLVNQTKNIGNGFWLVRTYFIYNN